MDAVLKDVPTDDEELNTSTETGIKYDPKNTSIDDLNKIGRQAASTAAADKGAIASQNVASATRQAGGSKLFAALQAAQAAKDATQSGFTEEANTARSMALSKEQAENERAFNKAAQEFQAEEARKQAAAQREHDTKMAEEQRKHEAAMEEKRQTFEREEAEKGRAQEKEMNAWNLLGSLFASFF